VFFFRSLTLDMARQFALELPRVGAEVVDFRRHLFRSAGNRPVSYIGSWLLGAL